MRIQDLWVSCIRWFDTHNSSRSESARLANTAAPTESESIDIVRCLPFIGMHLMCLGVLYVQFSWTAVAVCAALYAVRMFAITGIYHRYFSHRTYSTNRFWQFIFAVLGSSAVQRGPLWWAAHHRHHHIHSDQAEDVHSPHQHSWFWSHMGWITSKRNFNTDISRVRDLAKYRELVFIDRFDVLIPILLGVTLFGTGAILHAVAPGLGVTGMSLLIWGFFVSTVVLFHATCTINSLSHLIGSRPYPTRDHSRNNWLLAIITFGEGWHNNHHHFPASTRQGFRWWQYDLTYYILKLMSWLRIVRDLRPVPPHIVAAAKA